MGKRITVFVLLMLSWTLPAQAIQQAYLVQNSGWMEPFYADQKSQFKPLVNAVIAVTASSSDSLTVAAFNQTTGQHKSPRVVYRGGSSGQYSNAVNAMQPDRKPGGNSFTDTDINEAVRTAIVDYFQGKSGILWLFTNNRNSPDNSQNTAKMNREFYDLLHREPSITRVLAFPVGMPVQGRYFQSTGAMIYALAYGDEAAVTLTKMVQSGQVGRVLNEAPARLKPLDAESVRILPVRIQGNDKVTAELAADQRTLVLNVDAGISQPSAMIQAQLINDFSPYQINKASVAATFSGNGWSYPLAVSIDTLQNLKPGDSQAVVVELPIPLGEIPSVWSLSALSRAGKTFLLPGAIDIQLDEQKLSIDRSFIKKLERLFPGDPLPAVFSPPEEVRKSTARIPVYLQISYPLYPLLVVLGAVILVLASIILLMKSGSSSKPVQAGC